jgi:RNA polymerase primary sigma factor
MNMTTVRKRPAISSKTDEPYSQRIKREALLVKRAKAGEKEALAELDTLTRPIRMQNAEEFLKRLPHLWDDAIQHGWLGVVHALEKYDVRRKIAFTHYCAWWTKNFIRDFAHENQKTVRRPSWNFRMHNVLKHRIENGESFDAVVADLKLKAVNGVEILEIYNGEISLDSPSIQGDDLSPPLIDTIKDENTPNEEHTNRISQLLTVFSRLDAESQQILTLHYGLDGSHPSSASQIARVLRKPSREIQEIIDRACEHLSQTLTILRNCDDEELVDSLLYMPWS